MTSADTAPIRTAILGFGLSGRYFHAPFLAADPNFEVTAVVTSNPERQDAAKELFPDVRLLDSVEDVLECRRHRPGRHRHAQLRT